MNPYGQDLEESRRRYRFGSPWKRLGPPALEEALLPMMSEYLVSRGLSYELARFNSWYPCAQITDRGGRILDPHPRIVIPGTNSSGFFFWQARYMGKDPEVKRYQSEIGPRRDSHVLVWPETLAKSAAIVEGPMDALAAAKCGVLGAALLGNTINSEVVVSLSDTLLKQGLEVTVFPDRDDLRFGIKLLTMFRAYGIQGQVRPLWTAKDLAAMPLEERQEVLERRNR